MPATVQTPRDRLQKLLDYAIRARRYWWIVAAFVVIGGALSVGFAFIQKAQYESSAVLFHQERIQTSLLQGREAAVMQRNIGERFRELLLARSQLAKIIEDPELNPYPDELEELGLEAAVEELRLAIVFQIRGSNTFRIAYKDIDPKRAKAVTERLTGLLIEKETLLRIEQANATVEFAQQQLTQATDDLLAKERARAQFLVAHPEFAEESTQGAGGGEGAAVRARGEREERAASGPSNPRLNALERQRSRIRARLAAANGPPPPRTERVPTATETEARRQLESAQNEVQQRQRDIEALRGRGLTDQHPDMRKAKEQLAFAQQKVKRAESALAAARAGVSEPVAPPANASERASLERELREVEQQIASERRRGRGETATATAKRNDIADQVVQLETEWARLRREVGEQAERVQTLNDSVFRAQLDAQTRIAEQGAALQVVDPAFLPKKPIGKGKRMLVLAGLVVFTGLGLALAVGLAIIDDRLYRRVDIEQLDIAPVLAVIPHATRRARRARKARKA